MAMQRAAAVTAKTTAKRAVGPGGVRFALTGAVLAAVSWALVRAAPGNPALVERAYSRVLYPLFAQPLSLIVGLFPFSVAEVLLLTLPLWAGLWMALYCRRQAKKGVRLGRTAARAVLFAAGMLGCAYTLYAFGWQLNYHRLPYAEIAGLDARPADAAELRDMCAWLIERTNGLRGMIAETPEGEADVGGARAAISGADRAWAGAGEAYPWLAGRYGSAKPVALSEGMSYMGIAGIYMPITFEANVNVNESPFLIASAAAHEQAHMRGFAREDEANYVAFAVTQFSDDPAVRYSGSMLALIHATNALAGADNAAWRELYDTQSEGVRRDLEAHRARWRRYEGPVKEAQAEMNDAYLRYNRQEDGVKSYGRMVDLLLAEYRREKGLEING